MTDQSQTMSPRKRTGRSMLKWVMVWAASVIASAAAMRWLIPEDSTLLLWFVAIVPILISVGAIRSYVVRIRHLDELAIKIELESLAAGFGAGIAFSLAYLTLEPAGAPELWFDGTAMAMFAAKVYVQITATRKYQ
jgi:hypothetical protein